MPKPALQFDSRALLDRLRAFPPARRYVVGFSGGADSTALLAALHARSAELDARLEAVHFNHGRQDESGQWQMHCRDFCAERGISFTSHTLTISPGPGNFEARAREARYRSVEDFIDPDTIYLTGHNADDRAETLLLHSMRGSGLDGLASIPECRQLGSGHVARPLLDFHRKALSDYLRRKGIGWIEDPSNLDTEIDRNFIRHVVIPQLEDRWPAARESLARSSRHLRTASTALHALVVRHAELGNHDELTLPVDALDSLGSAAKGLVLRAWLREQGAPPLPEARLEEFIAQLAVSAPGSQCETAWSDWTIRQFRDHLHLIPPGPSPECPEQAWHDSAVLNLGPGLGELRLSGGSGALPDHWTVAPRKAEGRIQLHPGGPRKKLKKVFQEQAIPPWRRPSIPVLYWNQDAVAIGDWCLSPRFRAWLGENGLAYRWEPDDPELRRFHATVRDRLAGGQTA